MLTASRPPRPAARAAASDVLVGQRQDAQEHFRSTFEHIDGPGVAPEHGGDLGDGRVLEQRPHRQLVAKRVAHAGHDLHREQGVAAVLEEVVVDADLAGAQRVGPDAAEGRLDRIGRRRRGGVAPGQRLRHGKRS